MNSEASTPKKEGRTWPERRERTLFSVLLAKLHVYYELTKPGIIYGNALTAVAGFFLASSQDIDWRLLLAAVLGLSFVIASACVFNNYVDREIDARMTRTSSRALAAGHISPHYALLFGLALLVLGILVLHYYTTPLALWVATFGFVVYVFLYTPLKPRSASALYVGAIAGATPPVVGYVAVTNTFDLYTLVLFAALYVWQIPHFSQSRSIGMRNTKPQEFLCLYDNHLRLKRDAGRARSFMLRSSSFCSRVLL